MARQWRCSNQTIDCDEPAWRAAQTAAAQTQAATTPSVAPATPAATPAPVEPTDPTDGPPTAGPVQDFAHGYQWVRDNGLTAMGEAMLGLPIALWNLATRERTEAELATWDRALQVPQPDDQMLDQLNGITVPQGAPLIDELNSPEAKQVAIQGGLEVLGIVGAHLLKPLFEGILALGRNAFGKTGTIAIEEGVDQAINHGDDVPAGNGQPALVPTALAQRISDVVRRQAVARKAREAAAEKLKGLDTCPPGTPNCLPLAIKADKLLGDQRPDLPDYSSAAELAAGEKVTDARRWLEGRYGSRLEAAGSARELPPPCRSCRRAREPWSSSPTPAARSTATRSTRSSWRPARCSSSTPSGASGSTRPPNSTSY
jgi:hypothetical protein